VVALPRDLLSTKSAACIKTVFAALGVTPNDQSVKAAGFDLPSLKIAGFDLAAFRAAGCDWATIKSYGFTATEVKAAGCDFNAASAAGFDLPSLRAGGFDIAAFRAVGLDWAAIKTAGFLASEAKAAGCDAATAKSIGYDEWSLLCGYVLEFNESPAVVATLHDHSIYSNANVLCVAFHASEPILATCSYDGSVKLWRLLGSTGTEPVCVLTQQQEHKFSFNQASTKQQSLGYHAWYHTTAVNCVAFHHSEPILVTCGSKNAKLWRLDWSVYDITASLIVELTLDHYASLSAVFHPIAPILMTLSSNVKLWQMKSDWSASSSFETLERHPDGGSSCYNVNFVAWHPSGQLLATCSYDSLKLWRLHESKPTKCVTTIQGHSHAGAPQKHEPIACVSFHPKLPIFVTGSTDSTAKLWQLSSDDFVPSCIATLPGHSSGVTSIAFHPFAPLFATSSSDGSAKLWLLKSDGTAAACVATLERAERNGKSQSKDGHQNGINCVAFCPSLPILATSSSDKTAKLWR
jgi:WD40 repeat protein